MDVGEVARVIWRDFLPESSRRWFVECTGLSNARAELLVAFIAASHDVGKANPRFQALCSDLARIAVPEELRSELETPVSDTPPRHDAVSGAALLRWLEARGIGADQRESLAAAVSGHHGTPRPTSGFQKVENQVMAGFPLFTGQQATLLDRVADYFGLNDDDLAIDLDDARAFWLAGLITIADWIGSDQTHFPVTVGPRKSSADLAVDAVQAALGSQPTIVRRTFEEMHPFAPRATQSAVIDRVDSLGDGPALLVIESITGSGKTEAAFEVVLEVLSRGGRGVFFALPTKATSNQMFGRIRALIQGVTEQADIDVQLVHSDSRRMAAALVPELGSIEPENGDSVREIAKEAVDWFTSSKRALIAPFGVGTIDQTLPAVMNAKHFQVRMWALEGKVVVIDELHAYDAYTGALISRLMGWLAALGCTVIVLSATLPRRSRAAMIEAFADGIGTEHVEFKADSAPSYPRIALMTAAGIEQSEIARDGPPRELAVEHRGTASDPKAIAAEVVSSIKLGGCAALVCNTVALAQERFEAVASVVDPDTKVLLLHSRLRPVERRKIEARLLDALGKNTNGRPERMVVVATQIVEQSLDIDFDVMLSDVAPVDLLLQRAGRVHRHVRTRHPGHEARGLVVLDTEGDDATRDFVDGIEYVYAPAVLMKTRLVLAGQEVIREPDDVEELIETVYGEDEIFGQLSAGQEEILVEAVRRLCNEERSESNTAEQWSLPAAEDADHSWDYLDVTGYNRSTSSPASYRSAPSTRAIESPGIEIVVLTESELTEINWQDPRGGDLEGLLDRAIKCTNRRVVNLLLADPSLLAAPDAWERSPSLATKRFLIQNAHCTTNLEFDTVLGLVVP